MSWPLSTRKTSQLNKRFRMPTNGNLSTQQIRAPLLLFLIIISLCGDLISFSKMLKAFYSVYFTAVTTEVTLGQDTSLPCIITNVPGKLTSTYYICCCTLTCVKRRGTTVLAFCWKPAKINVIQGAVNKRFSSCCWWSTVL